ncbi:MAG: hypothetical protein ACYC2K_15310 [Gemmatimonadales bacterium]
MRVVSLLILAAAGAVPLYRSFDTPPVAEAPTNRPDLVIKAMDYAFEMPVSLRPGQHRIRLVNAGKEMHHVWVMRLEEGKTVADLIASLRAGVPLPPWVKNLGGPNSPVPGGESVAVVDFAAGSYAIVCYIPSPDGTPHIMKGMVKPVEVAGEPLPPLDLPVTARAALTDYDFVFAEALTPGAHVIEFTNRSGQLHEAFLAKLAPGKTAADLLQWMHKPAGPPPAMPLGGITGIEPGGSQKVLVQLESGTYAWYCFVPDAKDGREHIHHGMVKQFSVGAPSLQAKGADHGSH